VEPHNFYAAPAMSKIFDAALEAKYEISVKVNLILRNFIKISGLDPDRIGSYPDRY
jgi:hypothetical protein